MPAELSQSLHMFWSGTKRHARVELVVPHQKAALAKAVKLGLHVFHLFEDAAHKNMLGTWRQDVTGEWSYFNAR